MTSPTGRVNVRPVRGGGISLGVRAVRPTGVVPEEDALMRSVRSVRTASATASREAIRTFRDAVEEEVDSAMPDIRGTLTPLRAQKLSNSANRALRRIEGHLASAVTESTKRVTASVRHHFDAVPADLHAEARQAARAGRNPLRRSYALVTAPTRQDVQAYIRSVTGKEPTEVAIRSIMRIMKGELPVEIAGAPPRKGAVGMKRRAERIVVSETFNTMREGVNLALDAHDRPMVALWQTREDDDVCPQCIAIAEEDVGYGPGWYPPAEWPKAPHPWCRCGQGDIRFLDE